MKLEKQFSEIRELIQRAKYDAFKTVNTVLIDLYWEIGKYVGEKINNSEWGKSVVKQLSEFIQHNEPDIKGFSSQNIWRMKQFYETYAEKPKLSALVREISWTNNLMIISKSTSYEEKEFYLRLSIQERYSSRELERQIDSGLFERVLLSGKKLSAVMREIHPNADEVLRDNYILDFLSLPKKHSEKDLRKEIIRHLKDFILEFGKDFTFVGEEYRVQVGNKDFYVDLVILSQRATMFGRFFWKLTFNFLILNYLKNNFLGWAHTLIFL